jgi:hypothetical protein
MVPVVGRPAAVLQDEALVAPTKEPGDEESGRGPAMHGMSWRGAAWRGTPIVGLAHGGVDAHIGGYPREDHVADSALLQDEVQVRCTERALADANRTGWARTVGELQASSGDSRSKLGQVARFGSTL